MSLGAKNSTSGSARPAALSAQVSGYPGAYVALVGANNLHFVAQAPGDYTVTVSGHSADGTALPSITASFTVTAPPVEQADAITATDPVIRTKDNITPADPGTDTVSPINV